MSSNVLFFEFYFDRITRNDECKKLVVFIRKKGFHPHNVKKEKIMSTYNFHGTIASRGYHTYKETTWSNAKVNKKVKIEIEPNQSSIAIDPYAFAVKAKEKYFDGWRTIAHVPREISRYIYFFIKKENGKITGNVKSLNCKPSPISSGTEIPLQLTFSCPVEWVRDKMKDFIGNFYSYEFTGILHDDE